MSFELSPVIAAVQTEEEFLKALESPVETVFLLHADILTAEKQIALAHERKKQLFVHMDMAEGIGKDKKGVCFLKRIGADGIISTRPTLIKAAQDAGLLTVLRFFVIDSHSIATATENMKSCSPNMAEMMPGILPEVISDFKRTAAIPIIAGGLIKTKQDVFRALSAGASAISTGKESLWYE